MVFVPIISLLYSMILWYVQVIKEEKNLKL